ncbi:MAG: hypothetical protein GY792_38190 [Gammaproteobacteria bacterium]|nr:hypothetical protein [Gammaproteobacteria bacterium]
MRCKTHGIGFTLYPPGYTPWGRKPWVPPDEVVVKAEDEADDNAEWYRNTYFEAALDAADGIFWEREKTPDSDFAKPSALTQECHLQRAIRLLGITQACSGRDIFAHLLCIPGQTMNDAAGMIAQQSDLAALGQAVCTVLGAIPLTFNRVFERLASCGAAVGLWPPLHVWCPRLRRLRLMPFPSGGTQAALIPV